MLFDEIKNIKGKSNLNFCRTVELAMILVSEVTKLSKQLHLSSLVSIIVFSLIKVELI